MNCWEGWGRFELAVGGLELTVEGWRGFELAVGGLELTVEGLSWPWEGFGLVGLGADWCWLGAGWELAGSWLEAG